ncbi:endonuclease III domain-containing protein [Candidatus Acetothermia bacterium]|nr:endonuclease III domain-containing protein [Candidatus Acetothermia bacterium]MBI3461003.1 endonuclease III domain-containing protein [Candidatus Acetothermia bacterium]MBI3660805.1 endonuclease III domain-containing protein [Candidatus Acetothermia bacterium]
MPKAITVQQIYDRLLSHYGHQDWWPADSPFEVIVGAILTQNTAWTNVEKALANLKFEKLLTPKKLARVSLPKLATLIRPAGYYNQKAKKLKIFLDYLSAEYGLNLERFLRLPTERLREELLSLWGIGEETADSICLYAANKPIFVVDAYTVRVFSRMGLVSEDISYAALQTLFMSNLKHDARFFNEYHALIVMHGKLTCRKREPLCTACLLQKNCAYSNRQSIS